MTTSEIKNLCQFCNNPYTPGTVYCGNCGQPVISTSTKTTLQLPPDTPFPSPFSASQSFTTDPVPPRQQFWTARKILFFSAMIFFLLLFIGAGLFEVAYQLGKNSALAGNSPSLKATTASGTTQTASNVTVTAEASTPSPSLTSTMTPSVAPSSTPSPLSSKPGILYQENGSDNWKGWALSSDWRIVSQGLLISTTSGNRPSAVAPYSVSGLQNFAVQAKMRTPDGSPPWYEFGITACGSTQGNWQGYSAGIGNDYSAPWAFIHRTNDSLSSIGFDPGKDWHTYRLEVRGNQLTFLIDNAPVAHVTDDQYLPCGEQVGFYNGGPQAMTLHVSSFEVIAL